jgi:alpha-beta hydrolase superfamily lysophospholipase
MLSRDPAWRRFEAGSGAERVVGLAQGPEDATAAVVMAGGVGGETTGPSGAYERLGSRLAADGILAVRLRYRRPGHLGACIDDVLGAIDALAGRGIDKVVILGWSFGGAVAITAGARSDRVVGVATVATQTHGADVDRLAPRALLLLHGTADRVLPDRCSRMLHQLAGEPRELVLYEGDDHGLRVNADDVLRRLHGWSRERLTGSPRRDDGIAAGSQG